MDPAHTIIRRLGGANVVAKITGVHRTRVSGWSRSRAAGGSDGRIPQKHILGLLAYAKLQGIALSAEDFLGPAIVSATDRAKLPEQDHGVEG